MYKSGESLVLLIKNQTFVIASSRHKRTRPEKRANDESVRTMKYVEEVFVYTPLFRWDHSVSILGNVLPIHT